MMSTSLAKLLFLEKRSQAMGLIQQLDNGFILAEDGQRMLLSDLSPDSFMRAFSNLTSMETVQKEGHFSTAMIDFGVGEIECVIKFGHRVADEPGRHVPSASSDYFWDFAAAAKEHGGQSFAVPLPNIYYLNTLQLAKGFQLPVCIMEYVQVGIPPADMSAIKAMIKMAMSAVAKGFVDQYKEQMTTPGTENLHKILGDCGWSLDDLLKFAKVLTDVTGGKVTMDVHENNVGKRPDGTLCVFDPLSFKH